jgi:hypothetical protein
MGKYLMLWEIDPTKAPIDPKERSAIWQAFMSVIKQDLESGVLTDWGAFVGTINGYCLAEGSAVEVGVMTQHYVPYVSFKSYPTASVDEVVEVVKKMVG